MKIHCQSTSTMLPTRYITNFYKITINRLLVAPLFQKKAAVDDFARGVTMFDAEKLLSYKGEITQDIKDAIYNAVSDEKTLPTDLLLFLKFPQYIRLILAHLSIVLYQGSFSYKYKELKKKYFKKDMESTEKECLLFWSLIKKYDYHKFNQDEYIPNGLPNAIYSELLRKQNFCAENVCTVFNTNKNPRVQHYPEFFHDKLKIKFPLWFKMCHGQLKEEQKINIIKKLLSVPSKENTHEISLCIDSGVIENKEMAKQFSKKVFVFLLNYSDIENKIILEACSHRTSYDYENRHQELSIKTTSSEIKPLLEKMFHSADNDENYSETIDDVEFVVSKYNTGQGFIPKVSVFLIGPYFVNRKLIDTASHFITQHPDCGISIYSEGENLKMSADDKTFTVKTIGRYNKDYVFVVNENNNSFNEQSAYMQLSEYHFPLIDKKQGTDLCREWFYNQLKIAKEKEKNGDTVAMSVFFKGLMKNPIICSLCSKATAFLRNIILNPNARIIGEDNYDPNYYENIGYQDVNLDFSYKLACEIIGQIPSEYIQHHYNELEKIGGFNARNIFRETCFALCSGVMPGNIVYKIALKQTNETMDIIDHIKCREGDIAQETIKALKEELNKKLQKYKTNIEENFGNFLKITNTKSYSIDDFPDLKEYAINFLKRHRTNEPNKQGYNPRQTDFENALQKLQMLKIFLVKKYDFLQYFGEENVDCTSFSPNRTQGFFSSTLLNEEGATVVVYINERIPNDPSLIVEKILGINKNSKDLNLSGETTLWHEVAHFLTDPYSQIEQNENYDTAEGWLKSPSELLAIQYGNLPYIEQKIFNIINKEFPENERINAGFIENVKSEIIDFFSLEFHGIPKFQALQEIENMINSKELELIALTENKNISRSQKVESMTNLFIQFYMGQSLKMKFEDRLSVDLKGDKIQFPTKIVPREPIPDREILPNAKDEIIPILEKRQDYKDFISQIKVRINSILNSKDKRNIQALKPYLSRTTQKMKQIFELEDLLTFIFQPPWFIHMVNTKELNPVFDDLVPKSLLDDVINIIEQKLIKGNVENKRPLGSGQPTTPDEARETGEFIAEISKEQGPDWVWMAKNKNFYKHALKSINLPFLIN